MRKTLIGILMMAVAIIMTLSGAVFAAETVTFTNPSEVKVGDTVTVTVKHPATATGAQYQVTYDKDILSTTQDSDNDGKFQAIGYTPDGTEYPTHTLTFTALKEGTANIALSNIKIAKSGEAIDTESTASTSVEVKATEEQKEEPKAEDTKKTEEPKAEDTNKAEETNKAEDTKKSDADKTKTTLKETKTGFDAMYVVYLVAAVLVAGGIVTVARRK